MAKASDPQVKTVRDFFSVPADLLRLAAPPASADPVAKTLRRLASVPVRIANLQPK
jgi:hypothetical protein